MKRSYVRGGAPDNCTAAKNPPVTVRGQQVDVVRCSAASVTGTGSSRTLGVDFCVPDLGSSSITLRFKSGREVNWVIRDGAGSSVWAWGRGAPVDGPAHEVEVLPGDCLTWRTSWSAVDDDGEKVERGMYQLTADLANDGDEYRYTASTTVE